MSKLFIINSLDSPSDAITDADIVKYVESFDQKKLLSLTVDGLHLGLVSFKQAGDNNQNVAEQTVNIFLKWKQKWGELHASPEQYEPTIDPLPPYTKKGLAFALRKAKLKELISQLNLDDSF